MTVPSPNGSIINKWPAMTASSTNGRQCQCWSHSVSAIGFSAGVGQAFLFEEGFCPSSRQMNIPTWQKLLQQKRCDRQHPLKLGHSTGITERVGGETETERQGQREWPAVQSVKCATGIKLSSAVSGGGDSPCSLWCRHVHCSVSTLQQLQSLIFSRHWASGQISPEEPPCKASPNSQYGQVSQPPAFQSDFVFYNAPTAPAMSHIHCIALMYWVQQAETQDLWPQI